MNEEPIYQLIHSVDPTKIKVPIRQKFAKLTLSSNKKKKDDQVPDKDLNEKRQSASRNLLESLSDMPSKDSESENDESVYINPLLRSKSSSEPANATIADTEESLGSKTLKPQDEISSKTTNEMSCEEAEGSEFMEPLQVSVDLTQQQLSEEKALESLTEKLSNLNVYPEIVLSSNEDLSEITQLVSTESQKRSSTSKMLNIDLIKNSFKAKQNISICISSTETTQNEIEESEEDGDDDDDEESVAITISDTSEDEEEKEIEKPLPNDSNDSFIPPTNEIIREVLPLMFSNDKDGRMEAFLRDVSFERREMIRKGLLQTNDDVMSLAGDASSNDSEQKAKTIAQADTESMTPDQNSFEETVPKEITEREQRLKALEDTQSMSSASLMAFDEALSQNEEADNTFSSQDNAKRLAGNETQANTFISEALESPKDRTSKRLSYLSNDSSPILKTPLCQKSTVVGNSPDKNLENVIEKDSSGSSILTNDSTPDLKTPICQRSTVLSNSTPQNLKTPKSRLAQNDLEQDLQTPKSVLSNMPPLNLDKSDSSILTNDSTPELKTPSSQKIRVLNKDSSGNIKKSNFVAKTPRQRYPLNQFSTDMPTPICQKSTVVGDNSFQAFGEKSSKTGYPNNGSPQVSATPICQQSTVVSHNSYQNLLNVTCGKSSKAGELSTPICQKSTVVSNSSQSVFKNSQHVLPLPLCQKSTVCSSSSSLETLENSHNDKTTVISNSSNDSFESLAAKSLISEESVVIPETASEEEESDIDVESQKPKRSTSSNEMVPSDHMVSEENSPMLSQISDIQMGIANINISAKFSIRIQISHQEVSDDDSEEAEVSCSSSKESNNTRRNTASLPASTEGNNAEDENSDQSILCQQRQQKINDLQASFNQPPKTSSAKKKRREKQDKTVSFYQEPEGNTTFTKDVKENDKNTSLNDKPGSSNEDITSPNDFQENETPEKENSSLILEKDNPDLKTPPPITSPVKDTSSSSLEAETDEHFLTEAEKLLNQLYGNTWKTPDVIRTLKRTSRSTGKSSDKKDKTQTPNTPLGQKPKTPKKVPDSTPKKQSSQIKTSKEPGNKQREDNQMAYDFTTTFSTIKEEQNQKTPVKKTPAKTTKSTPKIPVITIQNSSIEKENTMPAEESVLDDFSIFRRNIVKTNLDSTRLTSPNNLLKTAEIKNLEANNPPPSSKAKDLFKKPPQSEKKSRKVTATKPTSKALPSSPSAKATITTRSGRQVTPRWRQLIDKSSDSNEVNASDDEDVDCTFKNNNSSDEEDPFDTSSDRSWKSDNESSSDSSENEFEIRDKKERKKKNVNRSRKGEPKRITQKNSGGDDIIYLDLSQEEVSIVEGPPPSTPPALHDPNFNNNNRLHDILQSCKAEEKPKIVPTPKPKNSKRKLFTPNFDYEEVLQPPTPKEVKEKRKIDSKDGVDDTIDELENFNLHQHSMEERMEIINKQLEALKTGQPIFKVTPPRKKDNTPRKSPSKSSNSKPKIPSNLIADINTKTPKSSSKTKSAAKTKPIDSVETKIVDIDDDKNFKYGFLKSLDVCVGKAFCHPEAWAYRENYNKRKEELATRLYDLYNEKLFNNELQVPLNWNKKLTNTAGRCLNKKKMGVRLSIVELSEKVLTSADRLRCTLIHELCHAATWVFNGEGGHGNTWKEWARRANSVFPEIPKIGVCHQYDIEYKYTYKCVRCGAKSHAHSKSKKVENIRCSYCHGSIEIFLNKKDKQGNVVPTPVKEATGFAKFVQDNYKKFKKPNLNHGEIMKILGKEFAALKVNGQ